MCSASFQVGDWVQWKESGIIEYWSAFYWFEEYGREPCPNPVTCGDCKACGSQECSCANCEARKHGTLLFTPYSWSALERGMKAIKGDVREILDYLRDGENVTLPKDDEAREALRKEAEFYNLPGLSKMCAPYTSVSKGDKDFEVKTFHQGDIVQWKESAIEMYWKYFVR
ncbi:unnamed protein product [Cylicocyclus nassatus]|uniref:Uncharacterized protein n=1 Tax=Cylicocyclus nassatus TaxID=53992 RepID=A0AA36DQ72_CYLNA|nr:unnamed protein product [Cylicocyclus nassatus]